MLSVTRLDGVACTTCQRNTEATETKTFVSLPSSLIVVVRRFAHDQKMQPVKLRDPINVSPKLSLQSNKVFK